MSIWLAIDQGNTRIKYSIFDSNDAVLQTHVSAKPDLDAIVDMAEGQEISGGVYASVAGMDVRFIESLRRLCSDRLLVLTPATPVPVTNRYASRSTLGVDRLAAAVAAAQICAGKAVMIADCGSALTCDVISPKAEYLGGSISPGVTMRLNALHAYTSRLPQVEWNPADTLSTFPDNTDGAIESGAVLGTIFEIESRFAKAAAMFPGCLLMLTGGDARKIIGTRCLDHLRPLCRLDLVQRGLISIFRYNENID